MAGKVNWRKLLATCGPLVGLLFACLFFLWQAPSSFRTMANVQTIARQSTIVGIGALGMTLVIVSAGIDLSVGSSIALSTVVVAWVLKYTDMGPVCAGMAGIGAGALVGLTTGLLIMALRVVPFIVTLGMMLIVRGTAKGIAHQQTIEAPTTWLNDLLASGTWWLWPPGVWLMLLLAICMALVLRYTVFGRHLFAVGSNEQTARLCGINVSRMKVMVYTISGAFVGLAGLMQFSRLTIGDPTVATGKELDIIAAVVIGGGSLSGGEGSILGSIVGALIMTVIRNGCSQMGISNWVQEIVTGVIIVMAVFLDCMRRRRNA